MDGGLVIDNERSRAGGTRATATAFAALFSVVGLSLYGLPLYYDFMVRELGWSRTMVTSGNAISKLIVGPLFGFAAGWIVDRFGPRRLMMAGIVMAGGALVGLGTVSAAGMFYFFYSATSAAGRCQARCCCRDGSIARGAGRWESPTSASGSAARWCRCWRSG